MGHAIASLCVSTVNRHADKTMTFHLSRIIRFVFCSWLILLLVSFSICLHVLTSEGISDAVESELLCLTQRFTERQCLTIISKRALAPWPSMMLFLNVAQAKPFDCAAASAPPNDEAGGRIKYFAPANLTGSRSGSTVTTVCEATGVDVTFFLGSIARGVTLSTTRERLAQYINVRYVSFDNAKLLFAGDAFEHGVPLLSPSINYPDVPSFEYFALRPIHVVVADSHFNFDFNPSRVGIAVMGPMPLGSSFTFLSNTFDCFMSDRARHSADPNFILGWLDMNSGLINFFGDVVLSTNVNRSSKHLSTINYMVKPPIDDSQLEALIDLPTMPRASVTIERNIMKITLRDGVGSNTNCVSFRGSLMDNVSISVFANTCEIESIDANFSKQDLAASATSVVGFLIYRDTFFDADIVIYLNRFVLRGDRGKDTKQLNFGNIMVSAAHLGESTRFVIEANALTVNSTFMNAAAHATATVQSFALMFSDVKLGNLSRFEMIDNELDVTFLLVPLSKRAHIVFFTGVALSREAVVVISGGSVNLYIHTMSIASRYNPFEFTSVATYSDGDYSNSVTIADIRINAEIINAMNTFLFFAFQNFQNDNKARLSLSGIQTIVRAESLPFYWSEGNSIGFLHISAKAFDFSLTVAECVFSFSNMPYLSLRENRLLFGDGDSRSDPGSHSVRYYGIQLLSITPTVNSTWLKNTLRVERNNFSLISDAGDRMSFNQVEWLDFGSIQRLSPQGALMIQSNTFYVKLSGVTTANGEANASKYMGNLSASIVMVSMRAVALGPNSIPLVISGGGAVSVVNNNFTFYLSDSAAADVSFITIQNGGLTLEGNGSVFRIDMNIFSLSVLEGTPQERDKAFSLDPTKRWDGGATPGPLSAVVSFQYGLTRERHDRSVMSIRGPLRVFTGGLFAFRNNNISVVFEAYLILPRVARLDDLSTSEGSGAVDSSAPDWHGVCAVYFQSLLIESSRTETYTLSENQTTERTRVVLGGNNFSVSYSRMARSMAAYAQDLVRSFEDGSESSALAVDSYYRTLSAVSHRHGEAVDPVTVDKIGYLLRKNGAKGLYPTSFLTVLGQVQIRSNAREKPTQGNNRGLLVGLMLELNRFHGALGVDGISNASSFRPSVQRPDDSAVYVNEEGSSAPDGASGSTADRDEPNRQILISRLLLGFAHLVSSFSLIHIRGSLAITNMSSGLVITDTFWRETTLVSAGGASEGEAAAAAENALRAFVQQLRIVANRYNAFASSFVDSSLISFLGGATITDGSKLIISNLRLSPPPDDVIDGSHSLFPRVSSSSSSSSSSAITFGQAPIIRSAFVTFSGKTVSVSGKGSILSLTGLAFEHTRKWGALFSSVVLFVPYALPFQLFTLHFVRPRYHRYPGRMQINVVEDGVIQIGGKTVSSQDEEADGIGPSILMDDWWRGTSFWGIPSVTCDSQTYPLALARVVGASLWANLSSATAQKAAAASSSAREGGRDRARQGDAQSVGLDTVQNVFAVSSWNISRLMSSWSAFESSSTFMGPASVSALATSDALLSFNAMARLAISNNTIGYSIQENVTTGTAAKSALCSSSSAAAPNAMLSESPFRLVQAGLALSNSSLRLSGGAELHMANITVECSQCGIEGPATTGAGEVSKSEFFSVSAIAAEGVMIKRFENNNEAAAAVVASKSYNISSSGSGGGGEYYTAAVKAEAKSKVSVSGLRLKTTKGFSTGSTTTSAPVDTTSNNDTRFVFAIVALDSSRDANASTNGSDESTTPRLSPLIINNGPFQGVFSLCNLTHNKMSAFGIPSDFALPIVDAREGEEVRTLHPNLFIKFACGPLWPLTSTSTLSFSGPYAEGDGSATVTISASAPTHARISRTGSHSVTRFGSEHRVGPHKQLTYSMTKSLSAYPKRRPTWTRTLSADTVDSKKFPVSQPEDLRHQAEKGASVGFIIGGGILSPTIGAQASVSLAMLRVSKCSVAADEGEDGSGGGEGGENSARNGNSAGEELSAFVHPLQFAIGEGEYRFYMGAIVGNCILIPFTAFVLIRYPLTYATRAWVLPNEPTVDDALVYIGWPSVVLVPYVTLAEGIAVSTVELLRAPSYGVGESILGMIGLLTLTSVIAVWVYGLWALFRLPLSRARAPYPGPLWWPWSPLYERQADVTARQEKAQEEEVEGFERVDGSTSEEKKERGLLSAVLGSLTAPPFFPVTTIGVEEALERWSHVVGDAWWIWCEFVSFLCAVVVGLIEGMGFEEGEDYALLSCRGSVTVVFVCVLVQSVLALTTTVPAELLVQLAVGVCSVLLACSALAFAIQINGSQHKRGTIGGNGTKTSLLLMARVFERQADDTNGGAQAAPSPISPFLSDDSQEAIGLAINFLSFFGIVVGIACAITRILADRRLLQALSAQYKMLRSVAGKKKRGLSGDDNDDPEEETEDEHSISGSIGYSLGTLRSLRRKGVVAVEARTVAMMGKSDDMKSAPMLSSGVDAFPVEGGLGLDMDLDLDIDSFEMQPHDDGTRGYSRRRDARDAYIEGVLEDVHLDVEIQGALRRRHERRLKASSPTEQSKILVKRSTKSNKSVGYDEEEEVIQNLADFQEHPNEHMEDMMETNSAVHVREDESKSIRKSKRVVPVVPSSSASSIPFPNDKSSPLLVEDLELTAEEDTTTGQGDNNDAEEVVLIEELLVKPPPPPPPIHLNNVDFSPKRGTTIVRSVTRWAKKTHREESYLLPLKSQNISSASQTPPIPIASAAAASAPSSFRSVPTNSRRVDGIRKPLLIDDEDM